MTTITPEQFEAKVLAAHANSQGEYSTREAANRALYVALAEQLGITVAPPAVSEEMMKLAREIAATTADTQGDDLFAAKIRSGFADGSWAVETALAALQHVERVVLDADSPATCNGIPMIMQTNILAAIGSNKGSK